MLSHGGAHSVLNLMLSLCYLCSLCYLSYFSLKAMYVYYMNVRFSLAHVFVFNFKKGNTMLVLKEIMLMLYICKIYQILAVRA